MMNKKTKVIILGPGPIERMSISNDSSTWKWCVILIRHYILTMVDQQWLLNSWHIKKRKESLSVAYRYGSWNVIETQRPHDTRHSWVTFDKLTRPAQKCCHLIVTVRYLCVRNCACDIDWPHLIGPPGGLHSQWWIGTQNLYHKR